MKPDSADRRDESADVSVRDWLFNAGMAHDGIDFACRMIDLDPDTVLDGPLVVLHPGQHVVEVRRPAQGETYLDPKSFRDPPIHEHTIITPYERRVVVVASGPEVSS